MADVLDANGLTVLTLSEILTALTVGMQNIYGADINVDQNSPDGQMLNIIAQAATDLRELLVQINANFDPDTAAGAILDQRVVINNITRNGGSYTIQPISVTVNATVTLQGLDSSIADPNGTGFTVQDANGVQWILENSATINAGTTSLNFRAQNIGAVTSIPNTITTPVTIVPGVTAVNNPLAALSDGVDQETDAQLRVRRNQSVALASAGYMNGLLGTVLNLDGVSQAALFENVTNAVDANGIPAHGIWLIVEGGSNADIANTLYAKKSGGADMKGTTTYHVPTPSGVDFVAKWDAPNPVTLYVKFNLKKTISTASFDLVAIANEIAANTLYNIGAFAETSVLTATAAQAIIDGGGGGVPASLLISTDNINFYSYIATTNLNDQFNLIGANIAITVI